MALGWASFFKLKGALCNRRIPLQSRLKLFESCVTPCVTYACGTWTMTQELFQKLRSTRRRMLRWMLGLARGRDEDWVDYMRRATLRSEETASACNCKDWGLLQQHRKCKLAAKCHISIDMRWSKRLLQWKPWFRCWPHRRVGRPLKRWLDDF